MTLTELKYIVAVARELHFGRAAKSCFVSQPTLSMGVKKLEEALGTSIFERNKNEISITPLGKRIVEQAQLVLEQTEVLKEIAQIGKDPLAGTLRMGAIYTIGPYLLPHLIPNLRDTCPNLHLSIDEDYTVNLVEKLKRGHLDIIIISLPFEAPGIITWPLYEEPFRILVPNTHALSKADTIPASALAEAELLLLGPGNCFRDQILQACPECNNRSTQQNMDGSSLETIRHMVASGLGVTAVPCTAAGDIHYDQRLIHSAQFESPTPSRTVVLAWRKSFHRQEVVQELYNAIQKTPLNCVEMLDTPPSE